MKNLKLRLLLGLSLGFSLASCGSNDDSEGGNGGDDSGPPVVPVKKLLVGVSVSARTISIETGLPETWTFQYDGKNRLIADNAWGAENKIEYQGDDSFPDLRSCGENPSGVGARPTAFIRYSRGEGDFNGVSTKYYQKTILGNDGNPAGNTANEYFYLDSDGRVIASGLFFDEKFQPSSWSYAYDNHGNLLKMEFVTSSGSDIYEFTYDLYDANRKGKTSEVASPLWLFGDDPWRAGEHSQSGHLPNSFRLRHALTQPNNLLSYTHTHQGSSYWRTEETYDYTYDKDGYPAQALVTYSFTEGGISHTYQYQQTYTYAPAH